MLMKFPMTPVDRDFDRLFQGLDTFFAPPRRAAREGNALAAFVPQVDLIEEKDALILVGDVPGMKPEDIKLEVDKGVLTISGERKEETKEETPTFLHAERRWGSFSRQLTLPEGVKADAIEAKVSDGVLTVRIPKPQKAEPRRIAVAAK